MAVNVTTISDITEQVGVPIVVLVDDNLNVIEERTVGFLLTQILYQLRRIADNLEVNNAD